MLRADASAHISQVLTCQDGQAHAFCRDLKRRMFITNCTNARSYHGLDHSWNYWMVWYRVAD